MNERNKDPNLMKGLVKKYYNSDINKDDTKLMIESQHKLYLNLQKEVRIKSEEWKREHPNEDFIITMNEDASIKIKKL